MGVGVSRVWTRDGRSGGGTNRLGFVSEDGFQDGENLGMWQFEARSFQQRKLQVQTIDGTAFGEAWAWAWAWVRV